MIVRDALQGSCNLIACGAIHNESADGEDNDSIIARLGHVVDYYFGGALAPAVVVILGNSALTSHLVSLLAGESKVETGQSLDSSSSLSLSSSSWCVAIRRVDPETCKMTRSLYDSNQTSNLRDDIIRATKVSTYCVLFSFSFLTRFFNPFLVPICIT